MIDQRRRNSKFQTQSELADAVSMSDSVISAVITAERPVPPRTVELIAEALSVDGEDGRQWTQEVVRRAHEAARAWQAETKQPEVQVAEGSPLDQTEYDGTSEAIRSLRRRISTRLAEASQAYDTGLRERSKPIYADLVKEIYEHAAFGDTDHVLTRSRTSLIGDLQMVISGSRVNDAWAMRMMIDKALAFLDATLLLLDVRDDTEYLISTLSVHGHSGHMTYWSAFESLRYSMEKREGHALPPSQLWEVCEIAIGRVEGELASYFAKRGTDLDLHEAIVLRHLRWPGLGGAYSEMSRTRSGARDTEVAVCNPVEVLWDVYLFDMRHYNYNGGIYGAQDDIITFGSARAFDMSMRKRGYPRDGAHWERLCRT